MAYFGLTSSLIHFSTRPLDIRRYIASRNSSFHGEWKFTRTQVWKSLIKEIDKIVYSFITKVHREKSLCINLGCAYWYVHAHIVICNPYISQFLLHIRSYYLSSNMWKKTFHSGENSVSKLSTYFGLIHFPKFQIHILNDKGYIVFTRTNRVKFTHQEMLCFLHLPSEM